MSQGTRVPFQTLSHSFSLKHADVCTHERTRAHTRTHTHLSASKQTQNGNERERCSRREERGEAEQARKERVIQGRNPDPHAAVVSLWRWSWWWARDAEGWRGEGVEAGYLGSKWDHWRKSE